MTEPTTTLRLLPKTPAVYALCAGDRPRYVVYVGVAGSLRGRVEQHLVLRDSSVTTGRAAARLQPELVREVRWWEAPDFGSRVALEAAELVAYTVLEPVLRSRGGVRGESQGLHGDDGFRKRMVALFSGEPTGSVVLPTLGDALRRLDELEDRVATLEALMREAKRQEGRHG